MFRLGLFNGRASYAKRTIWISRVCVIPSLCDPGGGGAEEVSQQYEEMLTSTLQAQCAHFDAMVLLVGRDARGLGLAFQSALMLFSRSSADYPGPECDILILILDSDVTPPSGA